MAYDLIGTWLLEHLLVFYLVIAWSLVWKGIALWKSARYKQLVWFIVLLLVNTIGILEIVYLIFFQKKFRIKKKVMKKKK